MGEELAVLDGVWNCDLPSSSLFSLLGSVLFCKFIQWKLYFALTLNFWILRVMGQVVSEPASSCTRHSRRRWMWRTRCSIYCLSYDLVSVSLHKSENDADMLYLAVTCSHSLIWRVCEREWCWQLFFFEGSLEFLLHLAVVFSRNQNQNVLLHVNKDHM